MSTTDTATPTVMDPLAAVSTLVDGDTVSRDNLFKEASPGATKKLTLALLLDFVAALFMPTESNRGTLAADETLTLGHMEYSYDTVAANRIVTLPDGSYDGQRIKVRGTMKNPSFKVEFQHVGSATVPITFPAASTCKRPWALLKWDTSGTDQWVVLDYGGGATLP